MLDSYLGRKGSSLCKVWEGLSVGRHVGSFYLSVEFRACNSFHLWQGIGQMHRTESAISRSLKPISFVSFISLSDSSPPL